MTINLASARFAHSRAMMLASVFLLGVAAAPEVLAQQAGQSQPAAAGQEGFVRPASPAQPAQPALGSPAQPALGSPAPPAQPAQPAQVRPIANLIGPEDQIVVRVAENPDLSDKPQRVDTNGEIRLPMVGRVQAAGLTPQQLEAELTTRYKVFINEPDIMVAVLESRSQPVSIMGAVSQPGVRQLDGRKTLLDMLLMSGGAAQDAGPTVTLTRRLEFGRIPLPVATDDASGQFSVAEIPLRPLLDGRAPANNVLLQPNDMITVSRAEVVYVIGEVGRPGPVPLVRGNSVSVLEAVSSIGGVLKTAKITDVRILRPVSGSDARTEVPVDLAQILAGQADDVAMLAGDILVVPDKATTGRRAVTRALEAALQLGLAVGTYGIVR